jgi:hypothetical protein
MMGAWATGRCDVPVREFLEKDSSFGPDDLAAMSAGFERALHRLRLTDRTDPATALVARKIIALAKQGERDPERLCAGVLDALGADGDASA